MDSQALFWLPFCIFVVIGFTFIAKYSYDRRHYKNTSRRAVNSVENTNTTVVYTIPTTGQLNTAYPELQSQYSNPQNRPPPYVPTGESPPSYDQAIATPVNQPQSSLVIK